MAHDWNQEYNDAPPVKDFPKPNQFDPGMYNLEITLAKFIQSKKSLTEYAVFEMKVLDGPAEGKAASRMFTFDPGETKEKIKSALGRYRHFVHTCLNGADVPPNDLELTEIAERFIGVQLRGEFEENPDTKKRFWKNNMERIGYSADMPADDDKISDKDVADAEDLGNSPF